MTQTISCANIFHLNLLPVPGVETSLKLVVLRSNYSQQSVLDLGLAEEALEGILLRCHMLIQK